MPLLKEPFEVTNVPVLDVEIGDYIWPDVTDIPGEVFEIHRSRSTVTFFVYQGSDYEFTPKESVNVVSV